MDLTGRGCDGVDSIGLFQGRRALVNMVMNPQVP
jgi:hypothetical protein